MPSAPDLEIFLSDEELPHGSSGSFSDDGEDMFLTIDPLDGNEFPIVERPRDLMKRDSLQKEKQVSVDPMSLVMAPTIREASFTLVSTPPRAPRSPGNNYPSSLPPPKLKFVTTSLPSSASSSPRSRLSVSKKPWEGNYSASPECPRPHQDMSMKKSGSEGEGRASISADDFNILIQRPSTDQRSFSKPGSGRRSEVPEDGFKCGKLCLFLPRGKGKAMRASSSNSISSIASRMTSITSHKAESMPPRVPSQKKEQFSPLHPLQLDLPVISRRVSLERFDLGSSGSSVSDNEGEGQGERTNLFFDLPLEMIRYSVSEVQSAVTASFVFEKDDQGVPKNALPKLPSLDENRHGRFSSSSARFSMSSEQFSISSPRSSTSPPSVSPGRNDSDDEFTTFFEAQVHEE